MATLIPALSSCVGKMQAGEKRFAQRLEQLLDDDYTCWYEIPVGKRQRYADFIILHPLRGVLLVEVKDWKLETLVRLDKTTFTINSDAGQKTVLNPLEQARQCILGLVRQFEKDAILVQQTEQYKGKLAFPYGYGVVLTSITRKQFEEAQIDTVIPSHRVICRDEMQENTDPEDFQQMLWNMFEYQFHKPLSSTLVDRIRWHLFPEIRISTGTQQSLFQPMDVPSSTPIKEDTSTNNLVVTEPHTQYQMPEAPVDIVKVMDLQQEQLARSLGAGHRVIHGVAGSGKTLILGYRCSYLAPLLNKPILVLCYNIALAARLRVYIAEQGISERVKVHHFHEWCFDLAKQYHIVTPTTTNEVEREANLRAGVACVLEAVQAGIIPQAQYGAVMIDEGHDFEADWLRLASLMIDPTQDSLLLLYDDTQSIYNKNKVLDFSLSSVGIQARGRTTILKVNYRNTDEIFKFAYRFVHHYLKPRTTDEDHAPVLEPQGAGRHGFDPQLKYFDSFEAEIQTLMRWLKTWHERGMKWAEMGILYRDTAIGRSYFDALKQANIPCDWVASKVAKKAFNPHNDTVKLMTMHSSKGLEFPLIIIAGLGFMPSEQQDELSEAKLLYVAMTRATEKLVLATHQQTTFTQLFPSTSP